MIDVETEQLLTYKQARSRIPGRPTVKTIRFWVHNGILIHSTRERVYLERAKLGGRVYTSLEAIHRFLEMLNDWSPEDE